MGIKKASQVMLNATFSLVMIVVVAVAMFFSTVCGCVEDACAQSPAVQSVGQCTNPLCQCDVGGQPCPCGADCKCGQQLQYTPKFGLDPVGQSIVRGREEHLDQERRIRALEREIVTLKRLVLRNPYIPYPIYRDKVPVPQPIPDPFPDGFPFGSAPPAESK